MDTPDPQVFSGLKVLDLTRWVSGEFCTKIFADFGADVIKVEKPEVGSLTRHAGPFPSDVPEIDSSALFLHLNTNKRSVCLDFASDEGRKILLGLASESDLIVESFRPGTLERYGLSPEELHRANPRAVIVRISAFGQTGRYRDYESSGLVLQAMGGPMHATGAADRAPHRKPGNLEHYTIGRMAAEAALAGLTAARRGAVGSVVDVSGMEVLLTGADRRASYLLTAAYSGMNAPRGVRSPHRGAATFTGSFACRDGHVMLYVANQVFWDRFVSLVADDDTAFRARFVGRFSFTEEEMADFRAHVENWFSTRSKIDIMEHGQAERIPLTAFLDVGEVVASEHFRQREYFVAATHPVVGALEYAGAPWRMESGWALRKTAPLLGENTAEVLHELGLVVGSKR